MRLRGGAVRTGPRVLLAAGVLAALAACAKPVPPGSTLPTPVRSSVVPSTGPDAEQDPAGCPGEGVRVTAERGDAAMGYREMAVKLTNCGDRPYQVAGRPQVAVLGKDREVLPVDIVPSTHWNQTAHPVTLAPGQSTSAVLAWRNLVTDPTVVATSGVYLSVSPRQGAPAQVVRPEAPLDLGNTGRLEVSVWL
ncbi:DUF4232 domain-containing protein [Dactylosporangium sp. NPDC051485]|uniref:DUF4232 domain-containing protein n=1 Tax=Dactylosporangium sp. NPDC051485 TaxID=3154846 RepID=UPI003419369D